MPKTILLMISLNEAAATTRSAYSVTASTTSGGLKWDLTSSRFTIVNEELILPIAGSFTITLFGRTLSVLFNIASCDHLRHF